MAEKITLTELQKAVNDAVNNIIEFTSNQKDKKVIELQGKLDVANKKYKKLGEEKAKLQNKVAKSITLDGKLREDFEALKKKIAESV